MALILRPMTDDIPCGVQRGIIIEQADPECGQGVEHIGGASIGAAHFEIALEADFGKKRREVVDPIGKCGALAGKFRVGAIEQGAEGRS